MMRVSASTVCFAGAALTLLLVAVAAPSAAQDDSSYTPGFQVRTWHSAIGFDIGDDDPVAYATKVIKYRAIPFVAIGILGWLAIMFWGCCRCCCSKCFCNLQKASFCGRFSFLLLVITVIASLGLVGGGFQASKQQNTVFENFPGVADSVASYVTDVDGFTTDVTNTSATLISLAEDLKNEDPGELAISSADVTAFQDFVAIIRDSATTVNDGVAGVDLTPFTDFSSQTETYNGYRNIGFAVTLGVLLAFLLIEALFAFLDYCMTDTSRPSENGCRFIGYIVAFITFLFLLLLWVLGGALIVASTASSDVCFDPDAQFLSIITKSADANTTELATFFLTCDTNVTLEHPYKDEILLIANGINDTLASFDNITMQAQSCSVPLDCPRINELLEEINNHTMQLQVDLGTNNIDAQGNAQDGFLSVVSCDALNGRYQSVLNLFCGDFAEALGSSTGVIVGFAVIYLFSQVITRVVSDAGRDPDAVSKVA